MPADLKRLLTSLSREDLQRLLNAKDEIEGLEQRRQALLEELAVVEKDLARLVATTADRPRRSTRRQSAPTAGARKKAAKKKVTKKKVAKKKVTKKKAIKKKATKKKPTAKKTAAKKTSSKKTSSKKTNARKATTKKTAARKTAPGRQTLEDVVMRLLQEHGQPMPFQLLLETIVTGGHFQSRSKNFDNVLRRTLSTSDRIKRLSRGVYGL
jgi:hypothetical protein